VVVAVLAVLELVALALLHLVVQVVVELISTQLVVEHQIKVITAELMILVVELVVVVLLPQVQQQAGQVVQLGVAMVELACL
jgi:hypothetical protein